jgi:hypothetical protein
MFTSPSRSAASLVARLVGRTDAVERQDLPWVPLERSYQWARFRDTLAVLQARHNAVFVLLGPMNTHLMTPASARRYAAVKAGMEAWLAAHSIPRYAPPALPSALYADASHPLAEGYQALAGSLLAEPEFVAFDKAGRPPAAPLTEGTEPR